MFRELPLHLGNMALFKVKTGYRDEEVCGLQWSWEVAVPELETSVFVIPADRVKNGETRLVVLNRVAQATERGGPMTTDNVRNLVQRAAQEAKLPFAVHPHMLRHACGYKPPPKLAMPDVCDWWRK